MRLLATLFIVLLSTSSYGQTQQGYVKTQGRPNKPGKALSGVTIRWRGSMNTVLSGDDGKFSAPFPDKKDGDAIIIFFQVVYKFCSTKP